jgi:hypothetical protein
MVGFCMKNNKLCFTKWAFVIYYNDIFNEIRLLHYYNVILRFSSLILEENNIWETIWNRINLETQFLLLL